MLRRLSTLSACFLLIALFVQTAEAQRTFHIGSGIYKNGTNVGTAYYYDSLESLWSDVILTSTIVSGTDSLNFILYEDQEIKNDNNAQNFFRITTVDGYTRNVTLTTNNNAKISIAPKDGAIPDTDFFRSGSQYVNFSVSENITITAGNNDLATTANPNRNALTIERGGNLTANGVTFLGGGPVVVDYNYGGTGSPRGTNAGDVHSSVSLIGAVFKENSYNDNTDFLFQGDTTGAVLLLKDISSGASLQNTKFIDNNAWGLWVDIDDAHYRSTANITINLGATVGEQTVFSGNGQWDWVLDAEGEWVRERQDSGPGNAIYLTGSHYSGSSQATITLNLTGDGEVLLYDNIYGASSTESGGGNYRTRVTMAGGTLVLGEQTVHQFNGTSQGTLGTGNRSNVWTHSGGTMIMETDSRIELTERFDQFVFSAGVIELIGDSDPTGNTGTTGNYIKAHTIDFRSAAITSMQQSNTKFLISGDLINELTPTNKAVLTIDAEVLTQPPTSSMIDFDITGIRGSITGKVLIHNEGSGTFQRAAGNQPNGNPYWSRTYRALLDGVDVINTSRIGADVSIANGGKDLVLDVWIDNKIIRPAEIRGSDGNIDWVITHEIDWRYETYNNTGYINANNLVATGTVPNDAFVFSDFSKRGYTVNIGAAGVYMSQQAGYLSQVTPANPDDNPEDYIFKQSATVEYGVRVSGVYDWTFQGGSFSDDFDPKQTYNAEQINHIGRLTFESIGTLNLFNNNPNVYHDGTVIGNTGFDRDSLSKGVMFDSMDGSVKGYLQNELNRTSANDAAFDIDRHTIMNVYGPGSLGSGKYAGETAKVAPAPVDGAEQPKDQDYIVQSEGFGIQFIGYGGTINIRNNTNYTALETDTLMDQRIRVVQGNNIVDTMPDPYDPSTWTYRDDIATQGIINMEEGRVNEEGDLINIKVTASDAYWVNHHKFISENINNNGEIVNTLNSGGTIFVDPNTYFEMTGHFDFTNNRILRSYEGTQITTLDIDRFDGGVLWAGYGTSVNMTGASFTGNGYFYDRVNDTYTQNGHVRYGGAIYFTGGVNDFTGETATLTLNAGSDGATNVAQNVAGVGGAIYVSQGAGAIINVQNVIFTENAAMASGETNAPVGGGAIFIWNEPDADGVLHNVTLNATGSQYRGNYANNAPGGAIRLFEGNTVHLDNSVFDSNGIATLINGDQKVVTTFGGAIYIGQKSTITADFGNFTSNAATGNGGAVYLTGGLNDGANSIFSFQNATFNGNIAEGTISVSGSDTGHGGAIYMERGNTTLNIGGAQFIDNTTGTNTSLGGAIYAGNDNMIINGISAVFDSNMVGKNKTGKGLYGGALYLGNFGTLRMNSAQFRGNEVTHSQGRGGAVYTGTGAVIDFTGASFSNNVASQEGGAIFTFNREEDNGTLTINGAGFSGNISKSAGGGAIFAANMIVLGDESSYVENEAATNGGALHLYSGHVGVHETKTVELNVANFDRNKALGGSGGALFVDFDHAVINANDALFLSNLALKDGGAIHATSHSTLNLNGATFGISSRFADDETPIGNSSSTGSGGAVYLNGSDVLTPNKATSKLNATGASFIGNVAAVDGGAVYLLYADASISGALFEENKAEAGRGGGLFYENENGKDLIVETAIFTKNVASVGGAVYTVNETFIHAKDTSLSYNRATGGDGGALYFASENSQLDISKSSTSDAIIERNEASGDGGAIRMQLNSKLVANSAYFFSNTAGGSGGAFRMDGDASATGMIADVQAAEASFINNVATIGNGGAIYLSDESQPRYGATLNRLTLNGSRFNNNAAGKDGGAIHATNTQLNIASSSFNGNFAGGNGGAIYLKNSDLDAWGASFTNNKAGAAGNGGAIYYLTTNDHERNIYLGVNNDERAVFDSNTMNGGVANSIYFETGLTVTSYVNLKVAAEGNGVLSMRDPMAIDTIGNLIDLDIVKTGTGTWELGGNNDFSLTRTGTTVDIKEGIFILLPGATLNLTNIYDTKDYFKLYSGAEFSTSGDSNTSGPARLQATNLDFAADTTMTLGAELILNIENDYRIDSVLSGTGALVKEDNCWLYFGGTTKNYSGNVSIQQGRLTIAKSFETTYGHFYMGTGTHLYLNADPDRPALTAKQATIDLVNLHISGISGLYEEQFILIHTTDGIVGTFATVGADGNMAAEIDYLTYDLGFLNDRKDYGGTIGLRWYSTANNIPAWGRFTLADENDYFNVGVQLVDNTTNLYTGDPSQPGYDPQWPYAWDGRSLDKLGKGTLELSVANSYTGKTTVHEGELYLSNSLGTGVGSGGVEVKKDARLGLNFTGLYEKTISGEGSVVLRGGTVELTADNDYEGGTVLRDGVMEFTRKENLGTGTITFQGGILRNKAETSLDQAIAIGLGSNAKFDVPSYDTKGSRPSLTLENVISGAGNLEKMGDGILALSANNTFTGTSYIREGGVKIDGSVVGDVRVSQYASVGGTGTIGGDLFLGPIAYYDWYYTPDRNASQPLDITGSVNLADGAIFRPRTDDTDFSQSIIGWTVMTYGGTLNGTFTKIDDSFNAFYSFELDYSTPGEVRVAGELLSSPRALGDIVATSLAISNKKIYRQAFTQLSRETAYVKTHPGRTVLGQQAFQPTRSIWFTPIARANNFGTTYVGGDYDFEAYGSQVGSTLWSDRRNSLGFTFGYERGNLKNHLDQIRSHDYYLGLYYGHLFDDGYELRTFFGGGFQKYTMYRSDTVERYQTTYDGSSFVMNVEYGKLFAGQNGTLLRPYVALDIEHGSISSGQEAKVGNAYRHYDKADLTQGFLRFGFDLEKRWQYVDWNGGLGYSCLFAGKRRAEAGIFYPVRGAGTTSQSARLGRSSITLKTGLNWHFDRLRSSTFFIDYFADIYMDRAGEGIQHTANLGYQFRF